MINIFIFGRSIKMDHVKPSLVHHFMHIQSIEMIPLHKLKEVIPNVQYKKWCIHPCPLDPTSKEGGWA
jgi:hypothetical protein